MSQFRTVTVGLLGGLLAGSVVLVGGPAVAAGSSSVPPATGGGDPADAAVMQSIASDPATRGVTVVRLDGSTLDESQSQLRIQVGARWLTATRQSSERLQSGHTAWYGNLRAHPTETRSGVDPLHSAVLIRDGDSVTGTIRDGDQLLKLRPLPSGGHALIDVDESRMPPEHPASFEDLPVVSMDRVNSPAAVTIRVLVVATTEAEDAWGGSMLALAELAVAETNQGYLNSDIGIEMELADYSTTDYTESGSFDVDLRRFSRRNDGHMDEIHALRNASAADVATLLIDNGSSCGLATGIGSKPGTAFTTAYWGCATGYYTFGHEIGHLQSARHNPETDPTNRPYRYGHGYRYQDEWRTVMAYDCPIGCPRLNFWSNPEVEFGGVPMGTVKRSDNHRVLQQTKVAVAGFR